MEFEVVGMMGNEGVLGVRRLSVKKNALSLKHKQVERKNPRKT
jgi:hypothetical protein